MFVAVCLGVFEIGFFWIFVEIDEQVVELPVPSGLHLKL
jgi:hypothetical protein